MEFGFPSGHAITAATVAGIVYSLYVDGKSYNSHKIGFIVGAILAVVYAVLMSISRVVLYKHTFMQIITGFEIGVYLAFTCSFYLQNWIKTAVTKIRQSQTPKAQALKICAFSLLPAILFALVHFIFLTVLDDDDKKSAEWVKWVGVAKLKCGDKFSAENAFYLGSFKMASYLFLLPGAFFGIFLE